MPASTTLARNWLFTLNNPQDFKPEVGFGTTYKYLIYQLEKGEEGTLHYQGYVMWKSPKRLSALKKLSKEAHWEPRRGSHTQARDYCSKEDTRVEGPWTFGVEPEQGKRTDLDDVKEAIDSGASMKEIAQAHFGHFIKYERGFRSYKNTLATPRDFKTEVIVCYGPTGTGKSMYCAALTKDPYWYIPQKDGKWWDGYDGQEDVIIDEFYGQIMWSTMLRLLDRYPMQVETKGATVNFAPKRIFITSNKQPIEWYPSLVEKFSTLGRRLDQIIHFPELGKAYLMNSPDGVHHPVPLPEQPHQEEPNFLDSLFSTEEFPLETSQLSLPSPPPVTQSTPPVSPQAFLEPIFPRETTHVSLPMGSYEINGNPTKFRRLN